ncbi:MAG: type VI secretion system tube protein Hcp [Betaproteobacteria bacterium]|nr:type VI secretion system tube protein Hcp [Betaproteobacteria bacterium]
MSIKNCLRTLSLALPGLLAGAGSAFPATSSITVNANLPNGQLIDAASFEWRVKATLVNGGVTPGRIPVVDKISWTQGVDTTLGTLWNRMLVGSSQSRPEKVDFSQPGTTGVKPYLSIATEYSRVTDIDLRTDTATVSEDFVAITMTYDPAGLGREGQKSTAGYNVALETGTSPAAAKVTAFTGTQPAAFPGGETSIYARLGGPSDFIPGASQAAGYENWIKLDTVNMTAALVSTAQPGGERTAPAFDGLTWTQTVDSSTPYILSQIPVGPETSYATLEFVKDAGAGPVTFMQITLSDVLFTQLDLAAGQESLASAEVSMSFGEFKQTVWNLNADGTRADSRTTGYDIIKGTPSTDLTAPGIPGFGKGNLAPLAPAGFAAVALSVPEPGTCFLTLAGICALSFAVRARPGRAV